MALPVDGGQIIHAGRVTPVGAKGLPRHHAAAAGFESALTPSPSPDGRGENAGSKSAPPFDKIRMSLTGADFVIASVAWQSRRRSNGGSPTCVQPHRDCHVATLLAMTEWVRMSRMSGASEGAGPSTGSGRAWKASLVRNPKGPEGQYRVFRLPPNVIASAAWQSRSRIDQRCRQLTLDRYVPIIDRPGRAVGVCSLGMIGWCILLVGLVRLRVSLVAKFILVRVI